MRKLRYLAVVTLAAAVTGCIDKGMANLEFEGYTQAGRNFKILNLKKRWRWRESPYVDRLVAAWTATQSEEQENRSEILVAEDAEQYLDFDVRSQDNRIWLIGNSGDVIAALDLETGLVYPSDDTQPRWAGADKGQVARNWKHARMQDYRAQTVPP